MQQAMILETQRLLLREMTQADFPALCAILQDADVMYGVDMPHLVHCVERV